VLTVIYSRDGEEEGDSVLTVVLFRRSGVEDYISQLGD
jgi:hypothetical protein